VGAGLNRQGVGVSLPRRLLPATPDNGRCCVKRWRDHPAGSATATTPAALHPRSVTSSRSLAGDLSSRRQPAADVAAGPPRRAAPRPRRRLTAEDGYRAERSYSIAAAPGEPVAISVERLDDSGPGSGCAWSAAVCSRCDRVTGEFQQTAPAGQEREQPRCPERRSRTRRPRETPCARGEQGNGRAAAMAGGATSRKEEGCRDHLTPARDICRSSRVTR